MSRNIVIDCPSCATRVNAFVQGSVHDSDSDSVVVLGSCPACEEPLLGLTQKYQDENNDWAMNMLKDYGLRHPQSNLMLVFRKMSGEI